MTIYFDTETMTAYSANTLDELVANHDNGIVIGRIYATESAVDGEPYYKADYDDVYMDVHIDDPADWYVDWLEGRTCFKSPVKGHEDVDVIDDLASWVEHLSNDDCVNAYGNSIPRIDILANMMDDELREELHRELAPCTAQTFVERYAEEHEDKFDEEWGPYEDEHFAF